MPNIEIKAKCPNIKYARLKAQKYKSDYLGHLHQVDTYYQTKVGRLKLREINGVKAQLIPYFKDYSKGPMKSCYELMPVEDSENLKKILDHILGTVAIVDKKREVFLIDNVRIHLDEVKNLGTFIEFEAVYQETSTEAKELEVKKVKNLMNLFEIQESDLLDRSYIDYLLEKNISPELEILYSFENEMMSITELKKTALDSHCPPELKYFWLLYDKKSMNLTRLDFKSSHSKESQQFRVFKQGHLKFDSTGAVFEAKEEVFHFYPCIKLGDNHKKAVFSYFSGH